MNVAVSTRRVLAPRFVMGSDAPQRQWLSGRSRGAQATVPPDVGSSNTTPPHG
jgi:hypothetical protein